MSASLLQDKIILVSGGSRGLGAGIARAAADAGAAGIMITGRDQEQGESVAAELTSNGTDVRFHAVDLADPLAAARSVTDAAAIYGRIDCVVNSAGITTRGTLLDTSVELFDAHIAINLRGTETEGEDATQRAFHGAGDDWVATAAAKLPMGKLGQVSEIAEFVCSCFPTGAVWSPAR